MENDRDTKRDLKPYFTKKEIVVPMYDKNKPSFGMAVQECTAEVLYVGEEQTKYKVGDLILFDRNMGREIVYFEKPLWVINTEISVICKLL